MRTPPPDCLGPKDEPGRATGAGAPLGPAWARTDSPAIFGPSVLPPCSQADRSARGMPLRPMTGILAPAVFAMHLATCAQQYPLVLQAPLTAQRHLAHASVESKLNPNAIHDNGAANGNGKGDVYTPETAAEAVRIARQLLSEGHRIDAGVMQVTDHNWAAYGLTVETVFDPARNICAGARI